MERIKDFSSFSGKLDEKVVMPEDFREFMEQIREGCMYRPLSIREANRIGQDYGVNVKDYDTFLNSLPQNLRHTAPPRNTPLFGFIGEDNSINVVLGIPGIGIRELGFLNHIIEHESVHRGQWARRGANVAWVLPDANDREKYFSNKDEIMAFSQSIVEMLLRGPRPINRMEDLERGLKMNPLWNDIKRMVDPMIQKRYLKYIYEYATNYLQPDNEVH
jgi:hypothetical protein